MPLNHGTQCQLKGNQCWQAFLRLRGQVSLKQSGLIPPILLDGNVEPVLPQFPCWIHHLLVGRQSSLLTFPTSAFPGCEDTGAGQVASLTHHVWGDKLCSGWSTTSIFSCCFLLPPTLFWRHVSATDLRGRHPKRFQPAFPFSHVHVKEEKLINVPLLTWDLWLLENGCRLSSEFLQHIRYQGTHIVEWVSVKLNHYCYRARLPSWLENPKCPRDLFVLGPLPGGDRSLQARTSWLACPYIRARPRYPMTEQEWQPSGGVGGCAINYETICQLDVFSKKDGEKWLYSNIL